MRGYVVACVFLTQLGTVLSQSCSVDGFEFDGLAHYLVGEPYLPGSIYADCVQGKATCYRDDGVMDAVNAQVSCDEVHVKNQTHHRQLGITLKPVAAWPQRIVCVSGVDIFPNHTRKHLANAFREFAHKADIMFIDVNKCPSMFGKKTEVCNNCRQFVRMTRTKPGCQSTWGYSSSRQLSVNLPQSCADYKTVLHQLGHVVGLAHEHSHPHRQVIVLRENVVAGYTNAYKILGRSYQPFIYDPMSIMHYDNSYGALCIPLDLKLKYCDLTQTEADGCVVPTKKHCNPSYDLAFGRSTKLMPSDVATIMKLYAKEKSYAQSRSLRGSDVKQLWES
ncbi:hypothetical protein Poli38472_007730 [Pythium oligandrum]|uniref:Metalloendopeptidase n=1 Tax=Pythium oligandrum TaxID=41045 RepID=A0A8K1CSC2_PYTOL|nr:hypothetical protein Poli38472_007730 [Pythium oligandrum]|eukprot:TMW68058.1 hypothetical protein Poli38472_007730 [Pythium oligandrum]